MKKIRKKEFHFPKIKSRRKELLDMAYKNLERDLESYFSKKDTIEKGIKDLHDILELKDFLEKLNVLIFQTFKVKMLLLL